MTAMSKPLVSIIVATYQRDKELAFIGIKMLRYKNSDINDNFIAVCEDLLKELGLTAKDLRE